MYDCFAIPEGRLAYKDNVLEICLINGFNLENYGIFQFSENIDLNQNLFKLIQDNKIQIAKNIVKVCEKYCDYEDFNFEIKTLVSECKYMLLSEKIPNKEIDSKSKTKI